VRSETAESFGQVQIGSVSHLSEYKRACARHPMDQAVIPCIPMTVTIQRVRPLDLSSITERTIPVTVDPISVNIAFSPRY
jgi:hypothetical protein